MMIQYYNIGGFLLKVEGDGLCGVLATMQSFETFRTENPKGEEPVCEFVETECAPPDFEKVIYEMKDLDTVFKFGYAAGGRPPAISWAPFESPAAPLSTGPWGLSRGSALHLCPAPARSATGWHC